MSISQSTLIIVDPTYPSYATLGSGVVPIRFVSLSNTIDLSVSQPIRIIDIIEGLSPVPLQFVTVSSIQPTDPVGYTSSAIYNIPANFSTGLISSFYNYLTVFTLTVNLTENYIGSFLWTAASVPPALETLPNTGPTTTSVTITENNTGKSPLGTGINIVFDGAVTSPELNNFLGTSASIVPQSSTPTSYTFDIPTIVPGSYYITILYPLEGGIFRMNIGQFTVTGDSPVICFKENAKILCLKDSKEQEVAVENLKKGMLVKTLRDGYIPIKIIGKSSVYNSGDNQRIKDRLYKLSKSKYENLNEDLYLTGCHAILVDNITAYQSYKLENILGAVFVTDNKYRLLACADEKAEPYKERGTFDIYHLALESNGSNRNYGIYANGLLVESCFENTIAAKMSAI